MNYTWARSKGDQTINEIFANAALWRGYDGRTSGIVVWSFLPGYWGLVGQRFYYTCI